MNRTVSRQDQFDQEARKLVDEQLIALGQRKSTLLRRKSKLTSTDTSAIAAALSKYVATNPSLPEGMVTALVALLESTVSNSRELTKQMNELLISNAQCGSPYVIATLASRAQPDVLGSVLSDAIRAKDTELVNRLLEVGADPKYLNDLEIIQLVKLDVRTFKRMQQSRHPIAADRIQSLCVQSIERNDVDALAAFIHGRVDGDLAHADLFNPSDRDALVLLVIRSNVQNILPMLNTIAARTSHWPLEDASILRIALENTQGSYEIQNTVFTCLFTQFQMPESFSDPLDIEYVFHQCLQNGRFNLISMMTNSNLKVPANIIAFICENDVPQVLDELLNGDIEIPDNLWSHTPSLMRNGSVAVIDKFLNYMFQHYIEVPHKEQLLMMSISAGQTYLIDRLIGIGVNLDFNAGETLRTAIFSENFELVKLLLRGQLHANTIEYGLLMTSLITPGLQAQMYELLLESGRPRVNIVNHLLLSILCDSSVEYNQTTMETLLMYVLDHSKSRDIAVRDYLNPKVIGACLIAKQSVQKCLRKHSSSVDISAQRLDLEMCQMLLPSDDPSHHQTESTLPSVDELLEHFSFDRENMPLKLFEKYIVECSEYIGRRGTWPLGIVELLLGRMSLITREHQSIYDCMSLAIDFAQSDLLQLLLLNAEFSCSGYQTLQAEQVLSTKELLYSILDRLNALSMSPDDYLRVVMPWFIHTCKERQLTMAISLCTRSLHKMHITPAIKYFAVALQQDINLPNIRRLLHYTVATQDDLEILWTQALRTPTVCHLDRIRYIMEAGYHGSKISKILAKEIALSSETGLLSTILDNWQVPNPTNIKPTYDYYARAVRPLSKPYINEIEEQYQDVLSDTLLLAITSQRPECCDIILRKGAPLVSRGISLLQKAVECGPNVSLKEDTVLSMILDAARQDSDGQAVVDFTLLQAVESSRIQLLHDLIAVGASPLAYSGDCWYIALRKSNDQILKALLSIADARNDLVTYFQSFLTGLALQINDLDQQCTMLLKLHKAGFTEQKCFDWAFAVLCDSGLLTPDRAQILVQCGASIDHRRMLRYNLFNGDQATFFTLLTTCNDHGIIQEIFLEACRKIEAGQGMFFGSNDPDISLSALEILFQFKIEQVYLDNVFESFVKSATSNRGLLPYLHALQRIGAQFSISSGETFAKCYMLDDLQLMSLASIANTPVETRSQALRYLLSEATTEQIGGGQATSIIPNLLRSDDKGAYRIAIPHSVLLDTIDYIFEEANASADLIHSFFSCIKVDSSLSNCDINCTKRVQTTFITVIDTIESSDDKVLRMEQIAMILGWMRSVGQFWSCRTIPAGLQTCSLSDDAFKSLFFLCCTKGLVIVLRKMIELNVDINSKDPSGHSGLFLATQANNMDVIDMLLDVGAHLDDGSLHVAISQQNHAAMSALLAAGYNPQGTSDLFEGATPLGVLFQNAKVDDEFKAALINVLEFIYNSQGAAVVTRAITASLEKILVSDHAYELMGFLMGFFELHEDVVLVLRDTEIVIERITYSALSLVRHWEDARLEEEQRELLTAQFEALEVKPCLFAEEGDQPANATGIPEHLQRKHAFKTKDCAICGDKPDSEHEIYARLTFECEAIHGWDDDIICADCLKTYLEKRMFPHDDDKIRYKFPCAKVFCWAPKCTNTQIEHHILRDLVDDGIFSIYDIALFQQECNSGSSMVKCATQDCPGAIWIDDEDKDQIKIFLCPVCFDNTCMECNDLYEKHDNQPCPAGAQARDDARKKAEEELSEAAMNREKRCPKCRLPYELYYGCEHITCGKNVYDNRVDKGCRYDFCNTCLGAWPNGHTANCALRA